MTKRLLPMLCLGVLLTFVVGSRVRAQDGGGAGPVEVEGATAAGDTTPAGAGGATTAPTSTQSGVPLRSDLVQQDLSGDLPRIFPLGDSITEAFSPGQSYRYWLWRDLKAAGLDADFIGSRSGVALGPPAIPHFDRDHEGHSGWTAQMLLYHVAYEPPAEMPDVALVLCGINDLKLGASVELTLARIDLLVEVLQFINPEMTILLGATFTPAWDPWVDQLAPQLAAGVCMLAQAQDEARSRVFCVELGDGFDATVHTWDGIHPNAQGEQKLATRWMKHLQPVLEGKVARTFVHGTGVAGASGMPELSLRAPPILGTTVAVEVAPVLPGAPSVMLFGAEGLDVPAPWGGGLMVDAQLFLSIPVVAPALSIPLVVPADDALVGLSFHLQFLQHDTAAPAGVSASPGLEVQLGSL